MLNTALLSARRLLLTLSDAQALPNTTNADSTNIIDIGGGGVMGLTPVFVRIRMPAITLTGILTIKVMSCDTADGTYAEYCRKVLPAAAYTGEEIYALGLINPEQYVKLNYVSLENLSSATISADIVGNL